MICNVNKLKRFVCFSKSKKNENSRNLYFSPYCNSSNVKICGKLQIPRVLHRVFILTLLEIDFYPITYHLVTKSCVSSSKQLLYVKKNIQFLSHEKTRLVKQ